MRRRTRGERFAAEAPRKAGRPLLTSASAGARVSAYPLGSPRCECSAVAPRSPDPLIVIAEIRGTAARVDANLRL
jgi:hypothetical protein